MLSFSKFQFCPSCSTENIYQNSEKSFLCNSCGFTYFHNPAPAVGAIVFDGKKLLLCRRAFDPSKDKLDFPGGFVDYQETLEQALVREVKEELNLEVTNIEYFASLTNLYEYKKVIYPTVDVFFKCQAKDLSRLSVADDVASYEWENIENLNIDDLAFDSGKKIIKKLK
ncbi:NUDIX domain-containing protein [bacterium]|jgi:mutator protein MutT|nr:NUDIX domain-containing protein [bacterium]